ncbi:MAG: hypothetical protein K0R26_58 [Bacteroidota bacterium]|nr:hypothetical protein [Bacteroidota bacterium]
MSSVIPPSMGTQGGGQHPGSSPPSGGGGGGGKASPKEAIPSTKAHIKRKRVFINTK